MTEAPFFPTIAHLNSRGADQQGFHEEASAACQTQPARSVFVRAVVEVSNFCRENCFYCGMRRDNKALTRSRARMDRLGELILNHRPASVTDINIQAGEDPVVVREVVIPLVRLIRRETPLGVSVCLGTLNPSLYAELKEAGASIYIIKFEIADPELYSTMHAPGNYEERLQNIHFLASQGWKVSSGFISGLPEQSIERLLGNFRLAGDLPLQGCSVSPFIPGDETPLKNAPAADIELTLNCMAAMRLMRPDWVIPAVSALNLVEPVTGYRRGLRTGANLVTINMTPGELRDDYLLYKRDRFIMTEEKILRAIEAENLEPSRLSLADYYLQKTASCARAAA